MKKLLVVILIFVGLAILGSRISGWQPGEKRSQSDSEEIARKLTKLCQVQEQGASAIMGLRQNGERIAKILSTYENQNPADTDTDVNKMIKRVILEAYEEPRFMTEEFKSRAITDYADKVFLRCLKEGRGKYGL